MSLQWSLSTEVPADTAALGEKIFPEDNFYRYLGDHHDELLPDEDTLAPMYCDTGRGAIPPLLMLLVTVFQIVDRVPDRMAAELVVSRMDWKYACHLPLDYMGFHFTDLHAFRVRLMDNGQERLIFEQVLDKLIELGLVKLRGKMRTDSTHVLGIVHRLSQLELVTEVMRVTVKAAQEVAPDWTARYIPPAFAEGYEERFWEFGVSDTEAKERLTRSARDAGWLLEQVDATAPSAVQALPELKALRVVMDQQFPDGPSGPPAKRPMGHDVIETPHERDARYGIKRGQSWSGYKAQVTETCDEKTPHLVTDIKVTGALDNDSPELDDIQERLLEQGTPPGEHLVDQGYMSGANLAKSKERGIELLGIPLADTQGPDGFKQTDFQIDEDTETAICPQGQKNGTWSTKKDPDGGPPSILVRFPAKICRDCIHFGQCTKSKQGRSLTLGPYRDLLQAKRQEAESEAYQKRLHRRAGIEGTISELVRGYGFRQARYRGLQKAQMQAYITATALNLRRAIRWLTSDEQKSCLKKRTTACLSCC